MSTYAARRATRWGSSRGARRPYACGGRLYFAGVALPTVVYYNGMRCEFVKAPGGLEPITDPGTSAPLVHNDLALIDPQDELVPIDNLGQEWDISGPGGSP